MKWLRRLFRMHSPSGHIMGTCWCAPATCTHPLEYINCIHGDQINALLGARAICTKCWVVLWDEPLPFICWQTGKPHPSYVED